MDATDKLKMALACWDIGTKRASTVRKGDFVVLDPDTVLEVVVSGGRQGSGGTPNENFIAFNNGKVEVYTIEELLVATPRPPQKREPVSRGATPVTQDRDG